MKNSVSAVFLIFAMSCGTSNQTKPSSTASGSDTLASNSNSMVFQLDTFSASKKQDNCKGDNCATCDLYYEKIKNTGLPVYDSVNMYIDLLLPEVLMNMEAKEKPDLQKIATDFIKSSQDEEFAETGAWSYEMYLAISQPTKELIEVNCSYGGYTGGAHGNYATVATNFFVKDGKQVTMQNLFNELDKVNKIGLKYFKKDNSLTEEDIMEQGWDISDADFTLNDNFRVSPESITWQYNSYEIGSYANGAPAVTIPMGELSKYLKVKLF